MIKKSLFLLLSLICVNAYAVGEERNTLVYDQNGYVINTGIIWSNQFQIIVTPTNNNQVVRYQELTNSTSSSITNVVNTGAGTGLVSSVSSRVANIASLIPGTGITLTRSGTTNITIASSGTGNAVTNANNFFTAASTNTFNSSYTAFNGTISNTGNLIVTNNLNTFSRVLIDGVRTRIDWGQMNFYDPNGVLAMELGGGGQNRHLLNSSASPVVLWENELLRHSGINSVDWGARQLDDAGGGICIDWVDRALYNGTQNIVVQWGGNTVSNYTGAYYASNVVVSGITKLLGSSNIIGSSTSTNIVSGALLLGTNKYDNTLAFATFHTIPGGQSYLVVDSGTEANGAGIVMGNMISGKYISADYTEAGQLCRIMGQNVPIKIASASGAGTSGILLAPVTNTFGLSATITNYFNGDAVFNSTLIKAGGLTGNFVPAVYTTNVMADFPSILAAASADLTYPVPASLVSNMPVIVSHPAIEDAALVVNGICSNGFVILRARNVGTIASDQGNLPYRIQVVTTPIQ